MLMINRIVCMHFAPGQRDAFLNVFIESKEAIRSFPGCRYLELLEDAHDDHRFFTYSKWDSESALNEYRNSELFQKTWAATKVLFDQKPMAWSTQSRFKIDT